MLCQGKSRNFYYVIRTLSTSSKFRANHYDVLGITPKATQGDIKTAYYKLSKIHHPDKSNNDVESAKKFRAITEAYEVLGNIKLKKMYDKGLLVNRGGPSKMEFHTEPEPTDPELKFYQSRMKNHITRTVDGKTPIYDFDAWSKNHYGNLFKQSQKERQTVKIRNQVAMNTKASTNQEALICIFLGMGAVFLLLVAAGQSDYDQVVVNNEKPSSNDKSAIKQAD